MKVKKVINMDLFENLQTLHEANKQSVDDLFEDITESIQERFGCDIDDTWYDVDNYPEEFKAQLVLYNVGYNIAESCEEIIKDKLSNYENIKIDIYEDSKYEIGDVDEAYVIQIRAYNDDFDF